MMQLCKKGLLLLAVASLLSSCANFLRKQDQPYLQVGPSSQAKSPMEAYRIQPRDLLTINLNSPDVNTNAYFNREGTGTRMAQLNPTSLYVNGYLVSDSGTVNLPMIGVQQVNGMTMEEMESHITQQLAKYITEFSVSVKLANFRVTVLGEVTRPAMYYFYESKVTLLQALSMAGDFQEYANRKKVRIVREWPDRTETFEIDLSKGDALVQEAFLMRTGDVVYVEPIQAKLFNTNSRVISVVLSAITAALTLYRIIQTN
jgi:polysaccharide export outer membrane protein